MKSNDIQHYKNGLKHFEILNKLLSRQRELCLPNKAAKREAISDESSNVCRAHHKIKYF